jgi:hypothetical protein
MKCIPIMDNLKNKTPRRYLDWKVTGGLSYGKTCDYRAYMG